MVWLVSTFGIVLVTVFLIFQRGILANVSYIIVNTPVIIMVTVSLLFSALLLLVLRKYITSSQTPSISITTQTAFEPVSTADSSEQEDIDSIESHYFERVKEDHEYQRNLYYHNLY